MDRKAIKAKAKEFAYQNKWNIWKPVLILIGIAYGIELLTLGIQLLFRLSSDSPILSAIGCVTSLAIIPLGVGLASYTLKLVRTKKVPDVNEVFRFYRSDCFWKILGVSVIAELIIFGFTLLFIIPGIIYAFKYVMVSYILAEQFDKEVKESPEAAYKVSAKMMDGHKWEYCVFQLSFIGWFLLCGLTLGILYIWIYPYYLVATTMWYDELKKISK